MGNIDKIKSTIKGWRLGDYFRQFSICLLYTSDAADE